MGSGVEDGVLVVQVDALRGLGEQEVQRDEVGGVARLLGVEAEAPIALPPAEPIGESAESIAARTARPAPPPKVDVVESTQVVVVGLVSVASIATFKRQLGRLPGVKNVGVSSGPDGEFIFTVGHNSDTSLSQLIPTLPTFQARVVSEREGVLNVSAHDPEAEG